MTANAAAAPRPASWKLWLLAARPFTLPASVVPVIVGTAAAASLPSVHWERFAAALAASILIQVGANFANDVFDFFRGADTADRLGPTRVTQSGLLTPRQVLVATYLTFGLAALLGAYLVLVAGWPILLIGVLSILAGLTYTGGPWPFGYYALGDPICFIFFGLLAVLGSAYLQTLSVTPRDLLAALPVAMLVTAILVVNNLRDLDTDRRVGKRTLAVAIGRRATRVEFVLLVFGAYLVPPLLGLGRGAGGLLLLLPWLSLVRAVPLARLVWSQEGRVLNLALKNAGQLHLLFGLLFAIGLWLQP